MNKKVKELVEYIYGKKNSITDTMTVFNGAEYLDNEAKDIICGALTKKWDTIVTLPNQRALSYDAWKFSEDFMELSKNMTEKYKMELVNNFFMCHNLLYSSLRESIFLNRSMPKVISYLSDDYINMMITDLLNDLELYSDRHKISLTEDHICDILRLIYVDAGRKCVLNCIHSSYVATEAILAILDKKATLIEQIIIGYNLVSGKGNKNNIELIREVANDSFMDNELFEIMFKEQRNCKQLYKIAKRC